MPLLRRGTPGNMGSVASWSQQLLQGLLLPLPATRWPGVMPKLKPADVLTAEILTLLQQSSQSPDNAADTYSLLMSPSPNDDSVLLVSFVSDSMAGRNKIPQQGSQKSDPPHLESRRPPSELSPSKVQNRPRATSMSSAPARNPPDIGIESNKPVPLLPDHASPSSTSRKSILKKRPSSTSLPPQAWPPRKSVRSRSTLGSIVLQQKPRQM
jgi:hypothetical protein